MMNNESVNRIANFIVKSGNVIMFFANWTVLLSIMYAMTYAEKYMPDGSIKSNFLTIVYGGIFGASILQYLARRRRGKARLYKDGVRLHDPDSGRDMHYECILRVHLPNLLVNPFAIFYPILSDVVRVSKKTGTASVTPKTVKYIGDTDSVCWNLGSNEHLEDNGNQHVSGLLKMLNEKKASGDISMEEDDILEGINRMIACGLVIK